MNTDEARTEQQEERRKKTRNHTLLRVVLTILGIVLAVWLLLFIVAVAAKYPSIPAMLSDMAREVASGWQRVVS